MFEDLKVGDEVSVYHSDISRKWADMIRYIGRQKVLAVTNGTLTIAQGRFRRQNGSPLAYGKSCWHVKPVNDELEQLSLRKQAERKQKASDDAAKASTEAKR